MSATPIDEEPAPPPTIEERIDDLYQGQMLVLSLLATLGDHVGMRLKHRQTDKGSQIYWQQKAGGRIIMPDRGN